LVKIIFFSLDAHKFVVNFNIVFISAFLCTGSLVLTNLCAFVVHLLIEAPVISIMKIVTGKDKPPPPAVSFIPGQLNCDEDPDA